MKQLITTIFIFGLYSVFGLVQAQDTEVFSETFDAAASVDDWTTAGDAASRPDEVTLEWSETAGVDGSGTMRFGGVNANGEGGRAFILEKIFTGVDYGGATDVTVSLSVKSEGLSSTNLSILTDINGSVQENPSATGDINETEFTTLTFTHSGISAEANSVKFLFNVAAGAIQDAGGTILVDNLTVTTSSGGSDGGDVPTAPTTNPEEPMARDAADVVSIYGDFYTSIDGVNYNPNWGQSGFNDVDPNFDPGTGNPVLAYPNFNYQGTEFPAQDLSGMNFVHIDIWVAEGTERMVKFTPIDGSDVGEFLVEVPVTPGSWNSVDLPKSAFTGMNWESVTQLKFDGQFNADGSANTEPFDVYVDNIFFYSGEQTATAPAAPAGFVANSDNVGSGEVFLAVGPNNVESADIEYRLFYSETASAPSDPLTATEYSFGSTAGDGGGNGAFGFNLGGLNPGTEYTFWLYQYNTADELYSEASSAMATAGGDDGGNGGVTPGEELLTNGDFENGRAPWTDTAGEIRTEGDNSFFYADVETAGDAFAVNLSQVLPIMQGERYILSFDASTGSGNTRTMLAGIGLNEGSFAAATEQVNLTDQTQNFELNLTATGFGSANSRVLFDMGADTGIVVIDNVSLVVDTSSVEMPTPEIAAPAPPARDSADVISLFSNAYDNITVNAWSAEWDQAEIEDVVIEDNDTKKVTFNGFLGVDFASTPFDASEMTHFHIDFWTAETELTGKVFNPKWSNHAEGEGETNAYEYTYALSGDETGQWVSIDVPLSEFNAVNGDDRSAFAQFLITSNLGEVYVDNIYLYKEAPAEPATIEAFSLLSPADETELTLTGEASSEAVIEWSTAASNSDVTYTWHADTVGSDFSDPLLSIPSDTEGQDTTLTLTFGDLDATLAGLGVEEGASITLDWTVTAMAGDSVRFADEVFSITLTRNMSTSIEDNGLPNEFSLNQNYPNPFNPTTNISYQIPSAANVTLTVFDITGREIARINEGRQAAGSYTVSFDASKLSSGLYIYRLEAGTFSATKKMMLIK